MRAGALSEADPVAPAPSAKAVRHRVAKSALFQLAAIKDRSVFAVMAEIALLWFGTGRLSLQEYLELKLFDRKLFQGVDKSAFVGLRGARRIWFKANFRVELFAMATNKIASSIWFAAHGLPILPTIAIFHENVGRPSARLLRNDDDLRAFLQKAEHYPLFGKPINGCQSIGSESLEAYENGFLITTAGRLMPLEDFIAYVKSHAAGGYLFQSRVSPHSMVGEMCGNRLATVRVLTVATDGVPKILRACWKIPAGGNAADNFWRPGNLLAQLDIASGRVVRVIRRVGSSYEAVSHHPDTGQRLEGMFVPNWNAVTALATEAATLLHGLPLVGWDIAPVDSGAVLVESNVTPDFQLHQLADRAGILDNAFAAFLRQRKADAAEARRAFKRLDADKSLAMAKACWSDIAVVIRRFFGLRTAE